MTFYFWYCSDFAHAKIRSGRSGFFKSFKTSGKFGRKKKESIPIWQIVIGCELPGPGLHKTPQARGDFRPQDSRLAETRREYSDFFFWLARSGAVFDLAPVIPQIVKPERLLDSPVWFRAVPGLVPKGADPVFGSAKIPLVFARTIGAVFIVQFIDIKN
jgi:hypothetical protein